jgi:hypothetical protein
MQKIETAHVRALYMEIGERMRARRLETKLPASLQTQMDRLSELDEEFPSIGGEDAPAFPASGRSNMPGKAS